jgi:hypothetical protein
MCHSEFSSYEHVVTRKRGSVCLFSNSKNLLIDIMPTLVVRILDMFKKFPNSTAVDSFFEMSFSNGSV